jgi:hypothetical protein
VETRRITVTIVLGLSVTQKVTLERLTRQFKKTRSKIANKTSKGTTWGVKE